MDSSVDGKIGMIKTESISSLIAFLIAAGPPQGCCYDHRERCAWLLSAETCYLRYITVLCFGHVWNDLIPPEIPNYPQSFELGAILVNGSGGHKEIVDRA